MYALETPSHRISTSHERSKLAKQSGLGLHESLYCFGELLLEAKRVNKKTPAHVKPLDCPACAGREKTRSYYIDNRPRHNLLIFYAAELLDILACFKCTFVPIIAKFCKHFFDQARAYILKN